MFGQLSLLAEILSALSCLVPYINLLSKILSGKYEICRVAYIQFTFSVPHVLWVRVKPVILYNRCPVQAFPTKLLLDRWLYCSSISVSIVIDLR